jgi:hypothetical protein
MKKEIIRLIFGIYSAIAVAICGYFYINPIKVYDPDKRWIRILGHARLLREDYLEFQYSVLLSVVVGILLLTILNFIKNQKIKYK